MGSDFYANIYRQPLTIQVLPECDEVTSGLRFLTPGELVDRGWLPVVLDSEQVPDGQQYSHSEYVIDGEVVRETRFFKPITIVREWDQFHADLIDPAKGGQVYSTLLNLSAFPPPGDSGCSTALATLATTINATAKNMAMDDNGKFWAMQGAIDFLVGVLKSRGLYNADTRQLLRDLLDANGFSDINVQSIA